VTYRRVIAVSSDFSFAALATLRADGSVTGRTFRHCFCGQQRTGVRMNSKCYAGARCCASATRTRSWVGSAGKNRRA
jgi:hypothetical protein